jgi:hypothetical protein
MKLLIAHRGLINGPDPITENSPTQIVHVLAAGYDAEIDVWCSENHWYLGHDKPSYLINVDFLTRNGLWIHAKNPLAAQELAHLTRQGYSLNYFWHQNDDRVLTSYGYWWTNPQQELGCYSIAVMPEWYTELGKLDQCLDWDCAGICSDYVQKLRS